MSTSHKSSEFAAGRKKFDDRYGELIRSGTLRAGNEPRLLHHDQYTDDAIVLVHGLSDSPFYMLAIANRFRKAGANVVLPLLPAHGLKDPGEAMEKENLYEDWREEVDAAVAIAALLGGRVSVGGLSTGGALSVDKTLRTPKEITGGVFLFSAALQIEGKAQLLGRTRILGPFITWWLDETAVQKRGYKTYPGIGRNPYKYPIFPNQGGLQLSKLLNQIDDLYNENPPLLTQPIFATHSIHDESAMIEGIVKLFKYAPGNRQLLIISDPEVAHASVVLEEDIQLDETVEVPEGSEGQEKEAAKNPKFEGMMKAAMVFFEEFVRKH